MVASEQACAEFVRVLVGHIERADEPVQSLCGQNLTMQCAVHTVLESARERDLGLRTLS
jgi:hypothetical protein